MPNQNTTEAAILRLPHVMAKTGLSRSSIYDGVKKLSFPAPKKLGARAVGWLNSEIESWIQSRKAINQGEAA